MSESKAQQDRTEDSSMNTAGGSQGFFDQILYGTDHVFQPSEFLDEL